MTTKHSITYHQLRQVHRPRLPHLTCLRLVMYPSPGWAVAHLMMYQEHMYHYQTAAH